MYVVCGTRDEPMFNNNYDCYSYVAYIRVRPKKSVIVCVSDMKVHLLALFFRGNGGAVTRRPTYIVETWVGDVFTCCAAHLSSCGDGINLWCHVAEHTRGISTQLKLRTYGPSIRRVVSFP